MKPRQILIGLGVLIAFFFAYQILKPIPTTGNWQKALSILSTAEFNGDLVTVKNIRNFTYNGSEDEEHSIPNYYDKTYDLTKLTKVWFIADPFKENELAAHTFVSFEFANGSYLSITIEARKLVGQKYSLIEGAFNAYPLMYIAADERDTILARAAIRKDKVYLYPVKTSSPEKARALLVDMLNEMNSLSIKPQWYNTIWDNCTSRIAYHINRVTPHRIPDITLATFVTGFADRFALEQGLLDTDLPLEQAREKYFISDRAIEVGNVEDFSKRIREFSPSPR